MTKEEEMRNRWIKSDNEIGQILAQALDSFPWYCDDQENFPGATEEDGVCVGEYTVEDLAQLAATRIKQLRASLSYYEARIYDEQMGGG